MSYNTNTLVLGQSLRHVALNGSDTETKVVAKTPKLRFSYQKVVTDRLNQKRRSHPPSYYLKENLKSIVRNCKWDHQDWIFLVTGMEGSGKSNLAISVASEMDPTFSIKEGMIYELGDYVNFLEKYRSVPFKALVFDEAISVLFSRQHATRESKAFIEFMNENRQLKHFMIFVVPSPFNIDIDIRERRFKTMLYVFHNRKTRVRKYAFYSQRIMIQHMNDGMRKLFGNPTLFMRHAPPLYVETFERMPKKLRKKYKAAKMNFLDGKYNELRRASDKSKSEKLKK